MLGPTLALVFALGWIPLFVYRAEAMAEALPHYSPPERLWVRVTPAVVAVHMTLACLFVSTGAFPLWRAAVALVLFVAATVFWMVARAQIGPLRITRLPDQAPSTLRRTGPFGVVRNPLYLGYLGAAAAPAIAAGHPLLGLTFAACLGAFAIRAEQEERRLRAQLGPAYAEYCRHVKRLIPFVW